MNIIDLKREVMDPDDRSPERTEDTEPLVPGASIERTRIIAAVLNGNWEPSRLPVATARLHPTVKPYTPPFREA